MKIKSQSQLNIEIVFVLNEQEARALHDIVGYGYVAFIEVFKEKLGKSYIEKHEEGCKSLFESVRSEMPKHFHKIDEARRILKENP